MATPRGEAAWTSIIPHPRRTLHNALGRRLGSRPKLWADLRSPRLVHPHEHRIVRVMTSIGVHTDN